MRFLFATLQFTESDFYGRVGRELRRRGHEVTHLTYSRRAAAVLRRHGEQATCLPDLMKDVRPAPSWQAEEQRIVDAYPLASLSEIYGVDPACRHRADDSGCAELTVRHFLAIEGLVERIQPDLVVPEVGTELIRNVSHLVGTERGATTLFLMYTIFDRPLRLYAGTLDAPIVAQDEVRPLRDAEEVELDDFIDRYTARDQPSRDYRRVRASARRIGVAARHFAVKALWDRDNPYLTPGAWIGRDLGFKRTEQDARRLYSDAPADEAFVYFPLQVTDDYKILQLRPHCADQERLVRLVAEALPEGMRVVVKEHPTSIGRNSIDMLRRLAAHPRIDLVDPYTSSLDLARRAAAVATISASVGLEALLYGRPVLTLGLPFYSGYGVTVDVAAFDEIPGRVGEALEFTPDRERTRQLLHAAMRRCYPGAPVLVDSSDENATRLAETLDSAARGEVSIAPPLAASG